MTLIMGCITRDYAVLASDRRLVWHAPGRKIHRTPTEENRNKAVLLCGQFYLGYTGLAAIERTDTDQWLAERLIERDPSKYFGTIAEESTRAFRWLRGDKRQAYLIVGWNVPEGTSDPDPLAVLITNYLADNGRTWLRQARDDFTVRGYTIPPSESHLLCWVGQELFPTEIAKLRRYLDLHVRRGGGPRGIAWLLATQIRAVAERNPLVGKALLLCSLPKRAVPASHFELSPTGSISAEGNSCVYVAEDRYSPAQYGPTVVCPEAMVHRPELWMTRPPWWRD